MLADKLKFVTDKFVEIMPKSDGERFKAAMDIYLKTGKMDVTFITPQDAGDRVMELLRRIIYDTKKESNTKKWYGRGGCYWCQPWWWNYWYNTWSPYYWWSARPYVGASPRVMVGNSNLNPQNMNISCNGNLCTMTLQFQKQ
jgi:hypothetical protein